MAWPISLLAGAVTGVLSGFGIGGGTLPLIYMTAFAATALPAHIKNGYIDRQTVWPAVLAGLAGTALAAWAATGLDVELLHRCFGGFLIVVGLRELFSRS